MKKIVFALILGLLLSGCRQSIDKNNAVIIAKNGILIEKSTIISTDNVGTISKFVGYVLIDNDKIVYTGESKPELEGNYKTINGRGKYTIPGLIDSHVHLANVAGMTRNHQKKYPQLVEDYYTQLPKSFLYYGYTTLIDVNNYAPDIINGILNSAVRPDIYTCGEQVQVMNDFMMEMEEYSFEDRLRSSFLYDKYNENLNIPDSINLSSHTPKSLISKIASEQQGICVKTLYEDDSSGFPQSWDLPTMELMRDLINEAHQGGLPVIIHAPSFTGQEFGIESGVDIIAHTMWNWYKNPDQFLDLAFSQDHKDLLLEIANKEIGYQPTFRAIYGEVDLLQDTFLNDPTLKDVYPSAYLNWMNTAEGQWGKQKILNRAKIVKVINPILYNSLRSKFNNDEEMFLGIQDVLKKRMSIVIRYLSENNAKLLFGTDAGAMNMSTNPPGYIGYLEMQHWVEAGVSLEKIFLAATFDNAKAFHLNDKYGSVEKGKIANLLLLEEDPLLDISAYNLINYVIVHGEIYDRNSLSAHQNN